MSVFSRPAKALSFFLALLLSLSLVLPSYAKNLPNKTKPLLYTQSLMNASQNTAGLNGIDLEYAFMPTTLWTTLGVHLPEGNATMRANLFDIPGANIRLKLGLTYNSLYKDLDIGLGKGWMSDLHAVAYQDSQTNDICYISPTGTRYDFVYDANEDIYLNPPGFAGEVKHLPNDTITVSDLQGQTLSFNDLGQFISFEKCSGGSFSVSYDINGNPISISDPVSQRSILLNWSQNGKLVSIKDPMNNTWALNYNESGQYLISLQQPGLENEDPVVTYFSYNLLGQLESQNTFEGYQASLSYHTSGSETGKLAQWTDPSGNETFFDYDHNIQTYSSKTTLTNAEGLATEYYIGLSSNQIESIQQTFDSQLIATYFTYDTDGWMSSVTNPDNHTYTMQHNESGKLISLEYPANGPGQAPYTEEWVYDDPSPSGKLIQYREMLTDYLWAETHYFYLDQDAPCLASKMINPDGSIEISDFNSIGLMTSNTLDPNGLNRNIQFSYAQNGNLTSVKDPENNETTYQYDINGRVVSETIFEGPSNQAQVQKVISIEHSFFGAVTSKFNVTGNVSETSTFTKDGASDCVYGYEECGVCYAYENPGVSRLPIFTVHNRKPWNDAFIPNPPKEPIIDIPQPPFNPPSYITTYEGNQEMLYTYDKTGKILEKTNPLGQNTQYTYDSLGRLSSEVLFDGKTIEYSYDILGQLSSKTVSGEGSWLYTRNAQGQITELSHPIKGLIQYEYSLRGDLLSDEKGIYSYDMMGRKISAQYFGGGIDQWAYRSDGTLASVNGIPVGYNKMGLLTQWSDGINQATVQYQSSTGLPLHIVGTGTNKSYSFLYDNKQRMIQVLDNNKQLAPFLYEWDSQNMLTSLSSPGQIIQQASYNNKKTATLSIKKDSNPLFSSSSTFNIFQQRTAYTYNQFPSFQENYSFSYDQLNRLEIITSASNNRTITLGYDQDNGKESSIDFSDKGTYLINRNDQGQVVHVEYPNHESEVHTHDLNGKLNNIVFPDTNSLSFFWDSKNRLSQMQAIEQMNQTIYGFNYNARGNLSSMTKSGQGFTTEIWQFTYGLKGLEYASRSSMGLSNLTLRFTRDLLGRALSITYQQAGGFNGEIIPHFDYRGNLILVTDLNGLSLASFEYDIFTNNRINEWNPQQLQLPINGFALDFQIALPFSASDYTITLPERGDWKITLDWGITSPIADLHGGLEDYEHFITWGCACDGWQEGKGKINEKDRENIKRELRRRGYKEKDLDGMVDEIEDEINNCCKSETDDEKGGWKKADSAGLVFGEAGEGGWWIRCKILPVEDPGE